MIEENAAATDDLDIKYNPLFLEEDNSLEQFKREMRNPLEFSHGVPLADSSSEGRIQQRKSLEWVTATFQPEDIIGLRQHLFMEGQAIATMSRAYMGADPDFLGVVRASRADSGVFRPSFWKMESLATDAGQGYVDPSAILHSQIHRRSKQYAVMIRWVDISPVHSLSVITESLTTNTVPEIDTNAVWAEILERFNVIAQRKDNWDGYESKSPNKLSLNNARQFMNEFVDAIVSEGEVPLTPSLISSDEDGHITVEWHGEGRQLHLQIEEDEIDYIQVWGPNIDTEMHVDTLHSKDYLTLWKWLIYGK